jgi:membrane protein
LDNPAANELEVDGRMAQTPFEIPAVAWKSIVLRVWRDLGPDHVGLMAAGVAFYGLLALFPAVTAIIGIAGLVFSPQDVAGQMGAVITVVPAEGAQIILDQAEAVAGSENTGLGVAAVFGVALAVYSASKGVQSLMEGINVAYDEAETRGMVRLTITRLALTAFLVIGMVMGLAATILLPGLLAIIDLGPTTEALIAVLKWLVLFAMTICGLMVIYRFAPDRRPAQWKWILPGSLFACVAWLAASIGFSVYVSNFAGYNETFGTLAGTIVLLMWLWLSAYVILVGAEINAEAEAHVRTDTTTGPAMPRGARGAVKADELV